MGTNEFKRPESLWFAGRRSSVQQMNTTKGENARKQSGQQMCKFGEGPVLRVHLCQLSAFFWFLATKGTAVRWQTGPAQVVGAGLGGCSQAVCPGPTLFSGPHVRQSR